MPWGADPVVAEAPIPRPPAGDDLPPLIPLQQFLRQREANTGGPYIEIAPRGTDKPGGSGKPGAWDVVSQRPITKPAVTIEAKSPDNAMGLPLPSEADLLFNRVRRAEGTAEGTGFVYYGGEEFTPGKDHPGAEARRPGPQGPTSAAGPGQWEEKTWSGLKPDFRKRFGRDPDFSSIDDQRAMTWLNAAKVYPGGEAKLREDIKAGKLNTQALAGQWSGFGATDFGGPWNIIGKGKWQVSDDAVRHGLSIPDAEVRWLDPLDYLSLLPPEGDAANRSKRKSLQRSVDAGEKIQDLPSLDVKRDGNQLKVWDYDGRNRAELALREGVGMIPVVIRGVGKGDKPSEIVGESGKAFPYSEFKPVAAPPPPPKPWWERAWNETGRLAGEAVADTAGAFGGALLGATRPLTGAAQLAGRAGEAIGIPGAAGLTQAAETATGLVDTAIDRLPSAPTLQNDWSAAIAPTPRNAAMAGDVAATAAIPVGRLAELGRAGRIAAPVATGAVGGAVQPVQPGGNYWGEKGLQTAAGAGLGAAGTVASEAAGAGANLIRRVVSPSMVTQAAARLFGENASHPNA